MNARFLISALLLLSLFVLAPICDGDADGSPSELLFTSFGKLYSVPDDGAHAQLIADTGVSSTQFSPDGRMAAYPCRPDGDQAAPQTTLCLRTLDSGSVRTLPDAQFAKPGYVASDGYGGYSTAWSPDSRLVAFFYYRTAEAGISSGDVYVYDIPRAKLDLLDEGAFASYRGRLRWSPDSRKLALTATPSVATATSLVVIDVATGDRTDVTHDLGAAAVIDEYAWSPDSSRLAVTHNTFGAQAAGTVTLQIVELAGGHHEIPLGDWYPTTPLWSPDGNRLAISAAPAVSSGGFPRVFVARADGTGVRDIAPTLASSDYPAWSPDSRTLAFVGAPQIGPPGQFPLASLYVAGVDSADPPRAVSQQHEKIIFPAISWAPTGKRIFYTADGAPCAEGCPPGVLFAATPSGAASTQIADVPVDSFVGWVNGKG